jgi:ankyrin repeat protein
MAPSQGWWASISPVLNAHPGPFTPSSAFSLIVVVVDRLLEMSEADSITFPRPNPSDDEIEDAILSARYGDVDDLTVFVSTFGADALADARDGNGNSALHMAAANGHIGARRDVLTAG